MGLQRNEEHWSESQPTGAVLTDFAQPPNFGTWDSGAELYFF